MLALLTTCAPQVCQLPTILAHPWFERLVANTPGRLVSKAAFTDWWMSRGLLSAPPAKRLWEVLRQEGRHYLTHDDFRPLLLAVLQYHPGLEFLTETPEFQSRWGAVLAGQAV
jgi:serine/threonine-protein phosphatase 2A regulatory subunit B''